MRKQLSLINAITSVIILLCACITAVANHTGFTTLNVNGETLKIYRDDFGIPHVFAETNRGLFEAYGYAVAQDRLWQFELNRRAARGRLAELFGPSVVNADRAARITGYTDAELDAQFATRTGPRGSITFTHRLIGVVASIPNSNRATYGQIVVLGRPRLTGETIFTLGQSGFLHLVLPSSFSFDPHYLDQLPLFRNFEHKPMKFFKNTQLQE